MNAFTALKSHVVVLPANDVDTDQIIPARFLKVTDKAGIGANLFADWRYLPDGSPNPDFILNQPESHGAQILLTGHNFGCGSSREHAPWALLGQGFRAVVSTSFADIFRNNALKNGVLPVEVEPEVHAALIEQYSADPSLPLTIDLDQQVLVLPGDKSVSFPIDSFSKTCLLNGVDQLGYLLRLEPHIAAFEERAALQTDH
jgi:3-isopropylmalate/(R)-2-methylmalate dehydratase small subunit